jgi:hypothetical protein
MKPTKRGLGEALSSETIEISCKSSLFLGILRMCRAHDFAIAFYIHSKFDA